MTDSQAPTIVERPTNVRWGVFSLAFATSALLYLHRYVFAFIKPTLANEWNLTNTELGQIDSAFSVCYTLFQFPIAIGADVVGVHVVLTALILLWCGGLATMAWAPTSGWMWTAQAALGTGQSAVYACLSRIASTWFPPNVRTTLQGCVGVLAGRLGALSSSLVFSTLLLGVLGLDWRTATWLLVGVGIAHAVLFVSMFRNSPRGHPSVNDAEVRLIEGRDSTATRAASPAASRLSIGETLRSVTPRSGFNLGCLAVQSILSTFADNIYSNWIPLFLSQVHRLDSTQLGVFASLPLLGGAIAGLVGGVLNDYFISRTGNRRWSRVGVAFVGKGMASVLMFVALCFYNEPYVFCSLLFFIKFFGDWSLTTSWGVVTDIGGRATASVFGINNAVASLGQIAAPLAFGMLADQFGWRIVFVTVGVTYALCAFSWLTIDCTIPVLRESAADDDGHSESSRRNEA